MVDFRDLAIWYAFNLAVNRHKAEEYAEAHQHEFPNKHPEDLTKAEIRQVKRYAKYSRG